MRRQISSRQALNDSVTPQREDAFVESTSIRFAGAARDLGRSARLCGLTPPSFTSPPRIAGYSRTIRRRPNGTTVSIVLRGRPWAAVLADMIEGIIVANELGGVEADRVRTALWLAVDAPMEITAAA
jgi:hypothetical protein